jgi:CBS domain-containing protein
MKIAHVLDRKGRNVVTVSPDTLVEGVLERMRGHSVGAVVVSTDGRRVEGIISERHVVLALARNGGKALRMRANQIMGPALTCRADDALKRVMAEMTTHRIRQCPVVEDDHLCGVVSIGDIMKYLLEETELEEAVLRDRFLASQ